MLVDFQARDGPPAGHCLRRSVSGEMPSRFGPRHWFQSPPRARINMIKQTVCFIISFRLHVVAEEDVLVADVHPAAENHRVGPALALAPVRLVEPAFFLVSLRRRLDERERAGSALAAADEMSVRVGDRTLAYAPVGPHLLARLELDALQTAAAVQFVGVLSHEDDPAMVILDLFSGVDLLRLELAAVGGDLERIAADAVTGGDEHQAVLVDRGWDHGGRALACRAPESLAVFRGDPRDARVGQDEILADAADFGRNERGVGRAVGEFRALPDRVARLLLEREQRALRAAGSADDEVAVEERGLGVAPARHHLSAELLLEIFPPLLLSGRRFGAEELSELSEREDERAVGGGRAAWARIAAACARLADSALPDRFSVGQVEGDEIGAVGEGAHRVDAVADDGNA